MTSSEGTGSSSPPPSERGTHIAQIPLSCSASTTSSASSPRASAASACSSARAIMALADAGRSRAAAPSRWAAPFVVPGPSVI